MSPKKIAQLALFLGGISMAGIVYMALMRPAWGLLNWWPAMGLVLAGLLLVTSYLRGAYLAAQKRAAMVDMLNDCYTGVKPEQGDMITE